jgi:hypothetical protein
MLILDSDPAASELAGTFSGVDGDLKELERRLGHGARLPLGATVDRSIAFIRRLIVAYITREGKKPVPHADTDLLEMFKSLVKGEPSWHAIRDNCRELVYYRNCINMGRKDALPRAPHKMAVRTARHVYLYMRTRCIRQGWLKD